MSIRPETETGDADLIDVIDDHVASVLELRRTLSALLGVDVTGRLLADAAAAAGVRLTDDDTGIVAKLGAVAMTR